MYVASASPCLLLCWCLFIVSTRLSALLAAAAADENNMKIKELAAQDSGAPGESKEAPVLPALLEFQQTYTPHEVRCTPSHLCCLL